MSIKDFFSSFGVVIIGLFASFLVWFMLLTFSHMKPQSFDPNPLVQELVEHPRDFDQKNPANRWFHLVGKDGVWSVKDKDGKLLPLEQLDTQGERLVLFLEAQGPTLALHLYEFLKAHDLTKKVVILTNSDGMIKDLRFHDGQLTLSCGQAYIIRFDMLRRLYIEGLMTIDMSAAVLDPKVVGDSLKDLAHYFHDHHVAVFIAPGADLQGTDLSSIANRLIE